jgi:hypothetical protein
MKFPFGCCDRTVELNCYGCDTRLGDVPTAWQLDFPAALSYLGDTTGSCTASREIAGTSPALRQDVAHEFEYPDIGAFGLGTLVEIDSAPVTNPALPFVACVWGSNDFHLYESAQGLAVEPSAGCVAGTLPFSSKGSDILIERWWENRLTFAGDLLGYGLSNRSRTILSPTSSDCSLAPGGCVRGTPSCSMYVFGIYARMRVGSLAPGGPLALVLDVVWTPRRFTSFVTMRNFGSGWQPYVGYAGWNPIDVGSVGGLTDCGYLLYPYATATQNIGQGVVLKYARTINCSTDLNGSPLVFTKIAEPKQRTEATQTILEAAGISGAPDEITMTPIA